jgi:putative transposase
MTTAHDIDWPAVLADRLTTCQPDVLRELLVTFIHTLMGAEADALCGAGYGQRSSERTNQRNGYRHRQFDTRTGSLDLVIPKLRQGSYFPDWLLERRKRAERTPTTVGHRAGDRAVRRRSQVRNYSDVLRHHMSRADRI